MIGTPDNGQKRAFKLSEQALGIGVVGVLAVMLVPLPAWLLDLLLGTNIMLSLLILMTVLHTPKPTDFTTFPTILLFAAVFRLALNVASTRLILGNEGEAGQIIQSFGDFVIGGNYVVGVVVFLILVVIQFVVITRGQNRISEVAARFTLDALPGRQMAIDADLNAGIISNDEAKRRREGLTSEAQFFGAMDGAGKFVRGDAIAGLIITAINVIGGLVIGMFERGLPFGDAAAAYTLLTVGDGLVSQMPALLVATGAGVLTARGSSDLGLSQDLSGQLLDKPVVLRVTGTILGALAFVPGMPIIPFLTLGSFLWILAQRSGKQSEQREQELALEQAEAPDPEASEQELEDSLTVDRLGIELGYRLIPLVDPGKHGGLLDHIRSIRNQFAQAVGLVIPPIRVRDDARLDPNTYRILLNGHEIASGDLRVGQFLAMDPGGLGEGTDLGGTPTVEPAFGLPARWIPESEKDRAELAGFTVIDAPSVLVTHLSEILRDIANELLTRDDVKVLLDNLKKNAPAVVDEVLPQRLSLGQIQNVLSRLLLEKVPIRDLQTILEALSDHAEETKDPRALTEAARAAIARSLVSPYLDEEKSLHAAVLDPTLEKALADAVQGQGGVDGLPPGFLARFVDEVANSLAELARTGRDPVLITRASLRPFLADAVRGVVPNAAVLSYQESGAAKRVETSTRVGVPAGEPS
ncbi:MAG: flagellar biosynthesis protein FlhA [Planctomycetota bacterium]